jgi:hypothetical protein
LLRKPSTRQILEFWRECLKRALRGNNPIANDWQWVIGIPLATFVLWSLGEKYPGLKSWIEAGVVNGAIATVGTAFLAFVITWIVAAVARLLAEPAVRYWTQKDRADTAEHRIW